MTINRKSKKTSKTVILTSSERENQEYFDRFASLYLIDENEPNYPKPNWGIWSRFRKVSLRDAIALALNISPAIPGSGKKGIDDVQKSNPEAWMLYKNLTLIVENRIDELLDVDSGRRANFLDNVIDLEEFGKFVDSLGGPYVLPNDYVRPTSSNHNFPVYMTKALRKLCDAAYDFQKVKGGGKQDEFAAVLANVHWESPTSNQRSAMATLASIFRPDEERENDKRATKARNERTSKPPPHDLRGPSKGT